MAKTFNDRNRAREAGRKGAAALHAKRRAAREPLPPYPGDFLAFRDAVGRGGPSRSLWTVHWRAADGLPLDPGQLAAYKLHTGRSDGPVSPCRELWVPAGRRSGKSENMALRATWRAISRPWNALLSPGEVGLIPIIASDRDQARNSLRYVRGLAQHPLVQPYVTRVLRDRIEFRTGAAVTVQTCSWRAVRGFTMLDAILEEVAFYSAEDSANPDEEVLNGIRPALLTVPDARLYAISSPYAGKGILWRAVAEHWGKDGSDVLVFNASTLALNPTVSARSIARAFADDPSKAGAEYGCDGLVTFRADIESFLSREAVEACVVPGRYELPPRPGLRYFAFTDPSGGSRDSFALAVTHKDKERSVLDCLREIPPPFDPQRATRELADVLKSYRVPEVVGDSYSGEWVREAFQAAGIRYRLSERSKSALYLEALALVNAGGCELLDHPRLVNQLLGLERRTARGGRDSIDHPQGGHDDLANAVAGALVLARANPQRTVYAAAVWQEVTDPPPGWVR